MSYNQATLGFNNIPSAQLRLFNVAARELIGTYEAFSKTPRHRAAMYDEIIYLNDRLRLHFARYLWRYENRYNNLGRAWFREFKKWIQYNSNTLQRQLHMANGNFFYDPDRPDFWIPPAISLMGKRAYHAAFALNGTLPPPPLHTTRTRAVDGLPPRRDTVRLTLNR